MTLEYQVFGLAALDCDQHTIKVGAAGAFACCRTHCDRLSASPDRGAIDRRAAERLAALATDPAFVRLDGEHFPDATILGGGGESMRVWVDGRFVRVLLYNVERPAFSALRDALLNATRCRP